MVDHTDVVEASPVGSNYIFILDVAPGVSKLGKDIWKTKREPYKFGIWCDLY